jgi:hypothetical protein
MACPYLRYQSSDGEHEFDHERPYCAVEEEFVSPMRADICNDRHDFDHEGDCDVYQRAVERAPVPADPAE